MEQEAKKWPAVLRLMTHPGVGPLTALAFVLIIGTPTRFHRRKQLGSYVGLIPSEDSSGSHRRLGHISKNGDACYAPAGGSNTSNRAMSSGLATSVPEAGDAPTKSIAKVAVARRLAVRFYWMWRKGFGVFTVSRVWFADQNDIADAKFSVTVESAAVPEPETIGMKAQPNDFSLREWPIFQFFA